VTVVVDRSGDRVVCFESSNGKGGVEDLLNIDRRFADVQRLDAEIVTFWPPMKMRIKARSVNDFYLEPSAAKWPSIYMF
jgi:hypothetical protein